MHRSVISALSAVLLVVAGSAQASGGHYGHHGWGHGWGHGSHFSLHLGAPYYVPQTVIIERDPPVYIQRQPAVAAAPAGGTVVWYYCPDPAGYYPYVQQCVQSWVSVDPATIAPPSLR